MTLIPLLINQSSTISKGNQLTNKHYKQVYLATNHPNQQFSKANNEKHLKILVREFHTPYGHEIPNY